MALNREEAERIITEFDKVANRADKKTTAMNGKMMMGIAIVAVVVIVVIIYLFIYRQKKGKEANSGASGGARGEGSSAAPSGNNVSADSRLRGTGSVALPPLSAQPLDI